jgi:hypothetical protein
VNWGIEEMERGIPESVIPEFAIPEFFAWFKKF